MHIILRLTLTRLLLTGALMAPVVSHAQATVTKPATKSKGGAKASTATHASKGASTASAPSRRAGTKPVKPAAVAKGAPAAATQAAGSVDAPPAGAVAPSGTIALRDAPDGQALATLSPQSTLVPLAHDRGWVRVRAEGWVKEGEVSPTDPGRATLSAADLRADPDGARGKVVRWDVEVLAMQTADPLRKGLNPDEPYLLARGPGNESALLYVAVPATLLATARTVASVAPTPVTLVATVRSGRSEPVGVPILDAQSLVRR